MKPSTSSILKKKMTTTTVKHQKVVLPSTYTGGSSLVLDFSPFETILQWQRMLECDIFVGARRSKHTAVAYQDAIYFFGGDNGSKMLNDFIRFDVQDKSWSRVPSQGIPPAQRYHHSAVVHGSSMLVFGGYTGDLHSNMNLTNKNDLLEYRFQTASWIEWKFTGKTPVPRSAHGAVVYDDKLYIYAGYDGNKRLNDMWAISLTSDVHQWEEIDQKGERPPTCCNFPVEVARDCMYLFSGQSGLQITNTLYEFNFKTKTWRRMTNDHILRSQTAPPSRRYGHTMTHHDRFLYVYGGSSDNNLPNDVHCYDLDAQIWSVIKPEPDADVPAGRVFHSAAIVKDAMYIFGGTIDNNVRSCELYRFQLPTYPRCTLHEDFGKLLTEHQFCDVQFVVGFNEVKLPAHIAIVAARSTVLKDKIIAARNSMTERLENLFGSSDMPAERPILEVKIPDSLPEAFEKVLYYIYTDRIDFSDLTDNKEIVRLMMDIFRLAVEYSINRLENVSIQYLELKISKNNVLDAYFYADKMNLVLIKDYCLNFIVKDENFNDIVMSNEFVSLDKALMVELVRKRVYPGRVNDLIRTSRLTGTTLENDMATFLRSGGKDFCDIHLVLEDRVIPAHKSILAARCSYFQAMFRSFMPSDNKVNIQIGDITPSQEAFASLLRYIYCGETKMPSEDSLYLFQASSFYGLTNNRLRAYCKHNLEHNIHVQNVLQILEASDRMNVPGIKKYALSMIIREFAQVARQPKIQSLNRSLLLEILEELANVLGELRFSNDLSAISVHSDI